MSTAGWADTITVGVVEDLSHFDPAAGVTKAMRDVARAADRAADEVEASFKDAAKDSDRALTQVGGGGTFRGVTRSAQGAADNVERSFRRAGDGIGSHMRRTVALIGGAFAALQVGRFFGDVIAEGTEAVKVGRQVEAVIKSTGGAAKVSADDIDALSTSLSNKAGVDDEVIASGAAVMLTFKGVRNEAGLNNDIFNQAEEAAVNLTAAMHQGEVTAEGLKGANIQLGKALQDPIKGITALTRVGVSFTQAQKDQIKKLVEAGDKMGAQRIILHELASEFGGAAEAAATPWDKLKVALGNVEEEIGLALLPTLNAAADYITQSFIPAAERWWKDHGPKVKQVFSDIKETADAFWKGLRDSFEPELDRLRQAWDDNRLAILEFIGVLDPDATDAMSSGTDAAHALGDALVGITTFAGQASRFLDQLGDDLNTLNEAFQTSGAIIHKVLIGDIDVIGLARDAYHLLAVAAITTGQLAVNAFVAMAQGILRAARSLVDSIPGGKGSAWSHNLDQAIGDLGSFRSNYNDEMDKLRDEQTNITANFGWQGLKVFRTPGGNQMLAGGGPVVGQGTPTSDSNLIWASHGEWMQPAASVDYYGARFMSDVQHRRLPRFAAGGPITTPNLHLPPIGEVREPLGIYERRIDQVLDAAEARFRKALAGMGGAAVQRGLGWARAHAGAPYLWGGVGPYGWDCSGWISSITNAIRGQATNRRLFSTASFSPGGSVAGFSPGLGPPGGFNIGVFRGSPGHMAGTLGGVNVESRGSMGTLVGSAARGATSGIFNMRFHLSGASTAPRPGDGDAPNEMTSRRPARGRLMDAGGWIWPGLNLVENRTGRPEPVPPPGAAGVTINQQIVLTPGQATTPQLAAAMAAIGRAEARAALGEYERRRGRGGRA